MEKQIGFIGIGNMGQPMVRNLLRAGYHLTIYDRDPEKTRNFGKEGVKIATTPAGVITPNGIIITMVTNDEALMDVLEGSHGLNTLLKPNNIHISMSTVSPVTIQKISEIHKKQKVGFVAAPVFGPPEAAREKKLYIFLAGAKATKNEVRPILESIGQGIYDYGENIASANIVKLAVNFMVLSGIETMAEAFSFIQKNNLDRNLFADMITQTEFNCPAYKYHAHKIAGLKFGPEEKIGFKLSLGMKDLTLFLKTAHEKNVPLPFADILNEKLLLALAKNRGDLDWAAIALSAFEDAGL